jgi:nucleotide-binding universal stress UspA family protein
MSAMNQPPAQPDSHPDVPGQMGGQRSGADPMKMHAEAVAAEQHLEALATLMAKADAPEQVVKAVGSMANGIRQIIKAVAKAPAPQAAPPATMREATTQLAADARRPQ